MEQRHLYFGTHNTQDDQLPTLVSTSHTRSNRAMGWKTQSSVKHFKKFLLVLNFGSGETKFFLVYKFGM